MTGAAETKREAECTGYRVDDLIIDIGRQRVMRGDQEIPLPQLSFEFFLALARAAPNVVTFDQLMERVWAGLVVSPETVSQRVKLVRDALGDDSQAPRYIAGVRGRGYRMQANVVPLPEPTPLPQAAPENPAEPPRTEETAAPEPFSSLRWKRLALAGAVLLLGGAVVFTVQLLRDRATSAPSVAQQSVSVPGLPDPKTIAVLPLIDISPGGGHEYLGDGLAEELTDRLVRLPGLRVAARTSSFAFKNQPTDVRKIAESLAVRYVLEGSVRREGDRLRVTAQLIDAETGYHLWSQSYDRTWRDLLDIQDDLARSIVERLELVLSSAIVERVGHAPTASLEAFDLYFAGVSKLRQATSSAQFKEIEALFTQALRADPGFVRAHAGLCQVHAIAYMNWRDTGVASKAETACRQALSLDPSLLEVETALANLYSVSGRGSEALAIFQSAVNKNPTDADAYIGLAQAYEGLGRTAEADLAFRNAISAEPSYWLAHSMRGNFLFQRGRIEDALTHYRKVAELTPGSAAAFGNVGAALQMKGDFEGAVTAFERSLALEPTSHAYSNLASAQYFGGRLTEAERMYRKATELAAGDHRMWGNLADALYLMEGRRAEAVTVYKRAIALASGATDLNSTDADALAHLAYYYARTGDTARAQEHIARAMKLGPQLVYVQYYAALIALDGGRSDAALNALERAVELGYPVQLVRAGPEFRKLRDDGRFLRLISATNRQEAG